MKVKSVIFFLVLFTSNQVFADSPLTSTDFCMAYKSRKVIKVALKADGELSPYLMKFLTKKKKPIALKLAVINALGWNINGKDNTSIFLNYLKEQGYYESKQELFEKGKSNDLICLGYLMALDSYGDVQEASLYAAKAIINNTKNSYSISLIASLIFAQKAMSSNWCEVFETLNLVKLDDTLNKDMKESASNLIFDYTNLYESYCD